MIRRFQVPYRPDPVEGTLIFGLIFQALLPVSALLFASGMVQDDIEEQTLTYFLIRPIPRWVIYLAKLLGTFVVTAIRAAVFIIATLVVVYWGEDRLVRPVLTERAPIIVALMALSLAAYVSIFGAIGVWFRRTLIVGAIYIVIFEGVIANIDFVVREATIMYHIRVLAVRWLDVPGTDWSIDTSTAPAASTSLIVLADRQHALRGPRRPHLRPARVPRQDAGGELSGEKRSFEEPAHGNGEAGEDLRDPQLLVGPESKRGSIGEEEDGGPRFVVEHEDGRHARIQILRDLGDDLRPSIARRSDLDDEFGHFRPIIPRQRSLRDTGVTVECNVRASNRVGIALGDHAGVIAQDMTEVMVIQIAKYPKIQTVCCSRSDHDADWVEALA